MADMDETLDRRVGDGQITQSDADEIRNFASFLEVIKDLPSMSGDRTEEQRQAFIKAYREHYPEDYAKAVAEQRARRDT